MRFHLRSISKFTPLSCYIISSLSTTRCELNFFILMHGNKKARNIFYRFLSSLTGRGMFSKDAKLFTGIKEALIKICPSDDS